MPLPRNIAIYGFIGIGRQCLQVAIKNGLCMPAALIGTKDENTLAALFAADTTNGRWGGPVQR
jgi:glyceraldehyde-3-phosphate dehydrogenase/erythrose-4-phosphate dehydrogenase